MTLGAACRLARIMIVDATVSMMRALCVVTGGKVVALDVTASVVVISDKSSVANVLDSLKVSNSSLGVVASFVRSVSVGNSLEAVKVVASEVVEGSVDARVVDGSLVVA